MRRGHLYSKAKELGCNKIALGHHFDDVIETILMGMIYGGQVQTMMPKLHSINFEGMELIRPLYMVREEDIISWARYNNLNFLRCGCRLTENIDYKNQDESGSTRQNIPLYMVREEDIISWARYNNLNFLRCGCRLTENIDYKNQDESGSTRQNIKNLIRKLREQNPNIEKNIFNSVENVNLSTIIGYHKDNISYNFLDDYDKPSKKKSL